jgi:hypothetical protein
MTFQLFFLFYSHIMNFNYPLSEENILTHQLYILSESKSFQKRRAKGRIFLLLIYLVTGIFIWQRNGPVIAAIFYIICLPLYFIYRRMEAKQYEKHISNYVHQQYKDALQHTFTLDWDDQQITSSAGDHVHTTPWLELESIVELNSLFILNFRNSNALIIPKNDKVLEDVVRTDLKSKAETIGVSYDEKLNWKWK